jgi:hypothetical protein
VPHTRQPNAELLQAALVGYQHQRAILAERIAVLTRELGGRAGRHAAADTAKPGPAVSVRERWSESTQSAGTPPKKTSRKLSAAGREAIATATRKRWATYRAEKAAAAGSLCVGVPFNQTRRLPKELDGAMSFADFLEFERDWSVTNRERGKLIDKSVSGTLSSEERRRLDALQIYADYHIDQVSPRPTDALDELELLLRPAGTR